MKIERHNVFTEETNKCALSSDNDKWMQSIYLIETYAYGTNKNVVSEKMMKCSNTIKRYKRYLT